MTQSQKTTAGLLLLHPQSNCYTSSATLIPDIVWPPVCLSFRTCDSSFISLFSRLKTKVLQISQPCRAHAGPWERLWGSVWLCETAALSLGLLFCPPCSSPVSHDGPCSAWLLLSFTWRHVNNLFRTDKWFLKESAEHPELLIHGDRPVFRFRTVVERSFLNLVLFTWCGSFGTDEITDATSNVSISLKASQQNNNKHQTASSIPLREALPS